MHPLERWFGASLSPIFRLSLALTLAEMVVLGRLDSALKSDVAPLGIISFELAGARAPAVLASFSEAARRDALLLQGLDYLYLLLYSTAIGSAALLLGRRLSTAWPRLAAFARPVAWMLTAAAVFDAIENVPLILMLRSGSADPSGASISQLSAIAKFALVAIGLVYLLAGGALALFRRQVAQ
jgi:hypothetical protein